MQKIKIGENCFVGNNTVIIGVGFCYLDDEVQIGPNCVIVSSNHTSVNGSYRFAKGEDIGPIYINHGSWIAANCTIAKGSKLPENSVLAANSFLNKIFEIPNSIYGGVPAKFIK